MKHILLVLLATVVLLISQTAAQVTACTNRCITEYNSCQFVLGAVDCMHLRLQCTQTCGTCANTACWNFCVTEYNSCQFVLGQKVCWGYRNECIQTCNEKC